jgi:hypothetical protein
MVKETTYGRYVIKSRKGDVQWSARAFRRSKPVGATFSGESEEAAILAAKAALDSTRAEQRAQRGPHGYPTATEVREALSVIPMTDNQRAMLDAHRGAPDRIMTATELADAGGYDSYVSANSQYGTLGRKLAEELEWEPPTFKGVPTWTFALATGADGDTRADMEAVGFAQWRWKLRAEIAEALKN